MSCTLLLLGMYVADCAVCRSHTRTGGVGGCMFSSFPQSHPTQPKYDFFFVVVVVVLCLSVCLFVVSLGLSCCIYVVVYFRHKKGKPGRVSKGGKGRGKVG